MSDDLTQKLPGDKESIAPQDDEKINVLISAVQSLSTNFQSLSTAFQEVEVRLGAIEKTVTERSFETKPIWERALAEIVATRAELAETRAELKAEIAETRAELKAEIAETRAELKAEIAETRSELRAEMKDGFRKLGLGSKMEVLNEDLLTLRGDQRLLDRRVENLESKTP